MTPTVGRIVHFMAPISSAPLAAIIVAVDLQLGVDRQAPDWNALDETRYVIDLQVFTTAGLLYVHGPAFAVDYLPNCWSWPPML